MRSGPLSLYSIPGDVLQLIFQEIPEVADLYKARRVSSVFKKNIDKSLAEVVPYEQVRIDAVKERYMKTLKEFENVDETRFYQEMAYFTEKLDIQEEKVRLSQHLKYYSEVMENEDFNGKKLGFISQEIGREINTLGSKANHAEIQKLVVMMKDDLEKIKEQTLNVL